MRITSSVEYGMRLVVRLAKSGGREPVCAEALSASENIPKDFVDQILRRLRRAGIVASVRGPSGGYVLAKPLSQISVGSVIRAQEGRIFEEPCERFSAGESDCRHQEACAIRPVWSRLGGLIEEYLDGVTLDQLLEQEKPALAGAAREK